MTNKITISANTASELALNFVRFLAQDDDRLNRFLALTGLDLGDVRSLVASSDKNFLGSLLDYALSDESLLIAFAANESIDPATIARARLKLPGATAD